MESDPKAHMCRHLQSESKNIDYLVLWLDCDREGENICFEVIDNTIKNMKQPEGGLDKMSNVYRAKFSEMDLFWCRLPTSPSTLLMSIGYSASATQLLSASNALFSLFFLEHEAITMTDLRKAMDSLGKPNENEARAHTTHHYRRLHPSRRCTTGAGPKSWRGLYSVGCQMNFAVLKCLLQTVAMLFFQTRFFQGKYGDLDSTVISYGPCQTPTLSFCVERHDRIQSFTPESFWNLTVSVQKKESGQQPVKLSWLRQRVFDKNVGNLFMQMIKDEKEAVVLDVSSEKKIKARPHALNTVGLTAFFEFQSFQSVELLKFGSSYLGISPSECMNIAERLYTQGYISYPRTETSSYPPNFDIRRVLEEQSSHPRWGQHCRELLDADFERPFGGKDIGDHPPITPMCIADEGELGGDTWRVYDYITRTFIGSVSPNLKYTKTTTEFHIGKEKFECSGAKVLSPGFTVVMHWRSMSDEYMPEFHKGESVDVMEVKLAEGSTSPPDYLTESEVIELVREGIVLIHGSSFSQCPVLADHPTDIVCHLDYRPYNHPTEKIDPELSLPTMRSDVEQQLGYIASGKASHAEVLQFYLDVFKRKFEYFVRKSLVLFPFSHIITRPAYIHTISPGMGCNHCPHPACSHSMVKNSVCACPQFEDVAACQGRMILDATSAPRWKLGCNECNLVSSFVDTINRLYLDVSFL
ncbi:DNA topoisomerase [Jimgerdemannia flammicorona]|uniref:DNA topoisomerase n=1 Tax=Jimgerdemannia flammicorona TaxID=994334 RepID=A0A433D4C1_9FUNG|nr:DNA topoisomerase [Jimgerdemannia flammicorona]